MKKLQCKIYEKCKALPIVCCFDMIINNSVKKSASNNMLYYNL